MDYKLDSMVDNLVIKECETSGIELDFKILAAMKKCYYQGQYDALSITHAARAAYESGIFEARCESLRDDYEN